MDKSFLILQPMLLRLFQRRPYIFFIEEATGDPVGNKIVKKLIKTTPKST